MKNQKTATNNDLTEETDRPIKNIQEMWDATIEYYEIALYDTEAMDKIDKRKNHSLTRQDIANVFSGVYADTYWNVTFMDPRILAKSMENALLIHPDEAKTNAFNAMKQWRGVFCRNSVSDIGYIPKSSIFTQSIDVICNENSSLPPEVMIENWNESYWKVPQLGKNFVYTRCQNHSFYAPLLPSVTMFATSGGFNQPPSSWQQLFTEKGGETNGSVVLADGEPGPMDPGVRGVSEAFLLELRANYISVIGVMASKYFTKNSPLHISPGNWNAVLWLHVNGSAVVHNSNTQFTLEDSLVFHNQDGSPENFVFKAQCRKVPVGSKIRLRTEDHDRPEVEFNTGFQTISNPNQLIQLPVNLPGHYQGRLLVHLEGPDGGLLPVSAAIAINMDWQLASGHTHYSDAFSIARTSTSRNKFITEGDIHLNLGTYTIQGVS